MNISLPTLSDSRRATAVLVLLAVAATPFPAVGGPTAAAFKPRIPGKAGSLFEVVPPAGCGVTHVPKVHNEHALSFLYHSGFVCGGVAIGDLDSDGKLDLIFGGAAEKNRIYRGTGDFQFTDISERMGALTAGERWTTGVSAVDVNGDGRLDIYCCNYEAPNQLFLNTGNDKNGMPQFREAAEAAGVAAVDSSHSAYFADYDRDGDLDLFLLTNKVEDPGGLLGGDRQAVVFDQGLWRMKPGMDRYYELYSDGPNDRGAQTVGRPDILFRNEGSGTYGTPKFTDVTQKAGISGRGDGLSATWWDYNNDGWPDIYVANDFLSEDRLWKNNGDGTFTNTLPQAAPHACWFSMGADAGDLNNDLLPDILIADMAATTHYKSKTTMGAMGGPDLRRAVNGIPPQYMRNTCLIGTGSERFIEGAYLLGIASTDWTWAVKFADLDLDGWEDIYFTNGMIRAMNHSDFIVESEKMTGKHQWEFYKDRPERPEKHRAYKNEHHLHFADVSDAWGLGQEAITYGCAYADFDRDGDLDLVEVNLGAPPSLYRNGSTEGHAVEFKLTGKSGNTSCYGARVTVTTAAGSQMRVLFPQSGYHSLNEAVLHFGLGKETLVKKADIRWPQGQVETLTDLKVDHLYVLEAPTARGTPAPTPVAATLFAKVENFPSIRHQEAPYDDYADQILLPHALSKLGPALVWGDVNGDGLADLFVGGGANQPGELRLADGRGGLKAQWVEAFREDKGCEDMGAAFFDAEGDGDLDLFVASGSYQFKRGDERLRDRLYLNDGKGSLTKATEAIPDFREASGPVCVADYDHDGRPDIYIGSRVVPGAYPETPPSRLLRNESAKGQVKFVDVTETAGGKALRLSGMVSGAVWSDVNGDGWQDLILAHEWGKVALFLNKEGKLALRENAVDDLAQNAGWWLSVDTADMDGDGDLDIVAGNFGYNTKYKEATKEKPKLLYYADFDGTGRKNIVEVKREGDKLFPERGRSCSSTAMPILKTKFPTFEAFAKASLHEVYGEKLETAEKFEANTLGTGIFFNEGSTDGVPRFRFAALDRVAQVAPTFGMVISDFDADGDNDLMLAQNFHSPQIETGRYDGGLGQLLINRGRGELLPVSAGESGMVIPDDAKAATLCDLDSDARPDLLISVNAGALKPLLNRIPLSNNKSLRVVLDAAKAPGARVTVEPKGGAPLLAEYHAGAGYLSQQAAVLHFGLGAAAGGGKVIVRWPDGSTSETAFVPGASVIAVKPTAK